MEQLAGFLPKFDPTFVSLTGSPDELAGAAREYKVAYTSPSDADHGHHAMIAHSGTMFVKDKAGKLRLFLWKNDISVADMERDVRLLLKVSG